jgi:AcrR family transcriptional regulator
MAVDRAGARASSPEASGASATTHPRERILAAASHLFTHQGIGRTGVDSLIASAGVAKATFYRHFPSKEALVVAWLRDPRTRWFDRVRTTAESSATTPTERISNLFGAAATWLEAGDYRGCPYLNTAVELADRDRAPGRELRSYLREIGAYLEQQLALAGHPDPAGVGRQLHTLMAGAISLGVALHSSAYVLAARDAALDLLG